MEESDFNTESDPTSKLKINSIVIKKNDEFLFPVPRDILQSKNKRSSNDVLDLKRLDFSEKEHLTSAGNMNLLFNPTDEVYSYESCWISEIDLIDYLQNDISNFESPVRELFIVEPKVGIARSRISCSSEEGKPYRVGMLRLEENIGICVDFEGIDIDTDFFKLDGEGKFVIASKIDRKPSVSFPDVKNNRFLFYLSTPAIFRKGWIPGWLDEDSLTGTIPRTISE